MLLSAGMMRRSNKGGGYQVVCQDLWSAAGPPHARTNFTLSVARRAEDSKGCAAVRRISTATLREHHLELLSQ